MLQRRLALGWSGARFRKIQHFSITGSGFYNGGIGDDADCASLAKRARLPVQCERGDRPLARVQRHPAMPHLAPSRAETEHVPPQAPVAHVNNVATLFHYDSTANVTAPGPLEGGAMRTLHATTLGPRDEVDASPCHAPPVDAGSIPGGAGPRPIIAGLCVRVQ